MKTLIQKLSSRKLWAAIVAVATGIYLLTQGNIDAGAALVISGVIGYLAAEGYVDGKAAQTIVEYIQDVAEQVDIKDDDNGK